MTSGVWESFKEWCVHNDPSLLEQWEYSKNGPHTPDNTGISSKVKIWWTCSKGHHWQAIVPSRIRGSGCPVCSNRVALEGYNDLTTTNPDLSKEWNYRRNGDLLPTMVVNGSGKNVWWVCSKGHEYQAAVCERLRGNGCPYCAGKRPVVGENDLATLFPKLAKEWNNEKNGELRADQVRPGSGKKVWWRCEKGHSWQAVISSRSQGNNCPYCGNQKLLPGFNDLETIRPDWVKQWHPTRNGELKPNQIFSTTGKKIWWKCENGHEWECSPNLRRLADGCPYCSGHRAIPGETDLKTLYPKIAKEWHPTKNLPKTVDCIRPGSGFKAWWICSKGHEWNTAVSNRVMGNGCPYCSGRKVIKGETDLATVYPEIAKEWHPTKNGNLTPNDVKPSTALKVWWRCEKGHEWQATLNDRSRSKGCPFCAMGRQASFNEKAILVCLQRTFPQLKFESNYTKYRKEGISELDIFIPELMLAIEYDGPRHTNYIKDRKKDDACNKVGITLLRVKEHLRKGGDEKFPEPYLWVSDHADYKEINDAIAKLELTIAELSGIKKWKTHADLVKYRSEIQEILIVHPEKSLEEMYPEVAKEWHPTKNGTLLPSEVYAGSNRIAWWMCSKGHEWEAIINSRRKNGCPYCANRRISKGENDLASTNPELVKEWHPTKNGNLRPEDVVPGTNKKVWWLGKCGHEWKSYINTRVNGRGCPICAGKKILQGFNDLQTKCPEVAKGWHPTKNDNLKPTDVTSTINRKVWWICNQGHEWQASIGSRSRGNGCPYCSGRYPIPGETDLATVRPELAKEWHPTKNGDLKPSDVTPESHVKIWWRCEKGHEWQKEAHGRGSCPYCSNRSVLQGYNDLKTKYPEICSQWNSIRNDGMNPSNILYCSGNTYWWICKNGHEWQSTIKDRVKSKGQCIECSLIVNQ